MRIMVSWIDPESGRAGHGVQWRDSFDQVPVVGDKIVQPFADGPPDVCEVVERYIYSGEEYDDVWHLVLRHVDIAPDRLAALRLVEMVEEVVEQHTDGGAGSFIC